MIATNCKPSAPTWNDKLELPDRSYPVSDVQDENEKRLIIHQ